MCNKTMKIQICVVLVIGILLGLVGCSNKSSPSIQTEEQTVIFNINDIERQNQETESSFEGENQSIEFIDIESSCVGLDEIEIVNAAEFGNPKDVLDRMLIISNVAVQKTTEDELQIEFELENVGRCTFTASKGKELALPDEVFVDSTKIQWTAQTAEGEFIFPDMKVNETGDMFLIDWAYNEYQFAIYGKSPQNRNDRDMAGKIALALIYNLSKVE